MIVDDPPLVRDAMARIVVDLAPEVVALQAADCASGIDCCGGFCVNGKCSSSPPTCSKVEDKCVTDADCCKGNQPVRCIGGFCAIKPNTR